MKLQDNVAIVTGGAGALGRAICSAFAQEGARLVLVDCDSGRLAETKDLCSGLGAECVTIEADVSDPACAVAYSREALHRFGRIDVLVNAAGVYGPIGNLVNIEVTQWQQTLNTNLMSTVYACHAVLPAMIDRQRGSIINLSGGGATAPLPRFSAYAVSKAAIVRLTETLAAEVAEDGVRVNAIAPGLLDTRFHDDVLRFGEASGDLYETIRELRASGKGGTPIDVPAQLAVFLASDGSGGLTGRLLSAPNDDWANWERSDIEMLKDTPWYTMRRIDRHTLRSLEPRSASTPESDQ